METQLLELVARPKKVMKSRAPGAEKTKKAGVKACATAAKETEAYPDKKGFTSVQFGRPP